MTGYTKNKAKPISAGMRNAEYCHSNLMLFQVSLFTHLTP